MSSYPITHKFVEEHKGKVPAEWRTVYRCMVQNISDYEHGIASIEQVFIDPRPPWEDVDEQAYLQMYAAACDDVLMTLVNRDDLPVR